MHDEYEIDIIVHLGARTDTTEFNYAIHEELNLEYSKSLWHYATAKQIPFIYASSAATYGSGEHGYEDSHAILNQLQPLNAYGISKNEFDKWATTQTEQPPLWTGLKFFNVYGPNEAHKGRMASVIFHAFNQIKATGVVKLFKSHRPDYKDGAQLRDFIYVKDLVAVINWMMQQMLSHEWVASKNGMYNLGTGKARSFYDLAANTFIAQGLQPNIEFIDMPEDIRDKYQYFTEANMNKLRSAGYDKPFSTLEEGVQDYVSNYLMRL
jgi:ADP-L-glycero-D-manno-heptose 6-epimerase